MAHQGQTVLRRLGRAPGRAGGALALCLVLAGCGAGESLDGVFGAQDTGVAPSSAGVNNTSGRLVVGTGSSAVEYECPSLTVRTGAATWQVTEKDGTLRHQGNIGQLARECAIVGNEMTVKVGITGRLLLGPKGTPGQFQVPLRVAVVDEGPNPQTITTKFFVVQLDIPEGQNSAPFTVVEDEIRFPLLKPDQMERYIIYVGFDPQGAPKEKPRARPSKPRTTTSSRPKPAPAASAPAASPPTSSSSRSSSSPSSPASDPGTPQSDVFGPPPSSPSAPSTGGFGPPPSAPASPGGFDPPPG